jgi:iron complex transport system substrate-binding protein
VHVVEIPTFRLADVAAALRSVGRIAGTEAVAERAAQSYEAAIRDLRASHAGVRGVGVFVEIDDDPLYTVNGRHVISEVVDLCGGINVFADLPQLAPPVAIEAVLARDPEVILSTDDTIRDPAALWRRWNGMKAVREGTIYSMSSDTLTRSTPRLAVGAAEVCAALDDARRRLK